MYILDWDLESYGARWRAGVRCVVVGCDRGIRTQVVRSGMAGSRGQVPRELA